MSAAAVIAMHRTRYIRRFRAAGATRAAAAVQPEAVGVRSSWLFRRMARRGVFVHTGGGRYYLDEPVAAAYLRACRNRSLLVTGVLLLLFALFLLW